MVIKQDSGTEQKPGAENITDNRKNATNNTEELSSAFVNIRTTAGDGTDTADAANTADGTDTADAANTAGGTDTADAANTADGTDAQQMKDTLIQHYQRQLDALTAERDGLKEQYLRTHADFENTKKRLLREKEQEIRFANQNLLLDIISFIDDLERALLLMVQSQTENSVREGLELIERQLVATLKQRWGLERIDALNKPFDPNMHEAIAVEPVSEQKQPTVQEVFQHGYCLHGRVIRSAKVKVTQVVKPEETSKEQEE